MGAENDRVVAFQAADEITDFDDLFRIKPDGRFIKNQNLRKPSSAWARPTL
jgi:hypothetical protein